MHSEEKEKEIQTGKSPAGLLIYPIVLAIITILVYANTLHGDFVWDDYTEILNNPTVKSMDNLGIAFTKPFWPALTATTRYPTNYYRPLKTVAYILTIRFLGLDPFHFHIVSIILHALVGITVFFIANNFIEDRKYAAIAAAIFIVHPTHSEAVAWIGTSFTDPMFSLFYLLAFSSYFFRGKFPKAGLGLTVSGIFFFASLLTKDPAFTFIPLVAFTQIFFQRPTRWKTRILHLGFFTALFVLYLVMRIEALAGFAPSSIFANLSALQLLSSAAYFFLRYLMLLIFPIGLKAFHFIYPVENLLDWRFLVSLPVLFLLLSAAVILWKKRSIFFFYLAWIPLTLFPMFYIKAMSIPFFCERYLYLPMVGYALILSHGIKIISEKFKTGTAHAFLYFCAIFIIADYLILTVKQNHIWKNDLTFYCDALKNYQGPNTNKNYCTALYDYDQLDRSLRCFENYALKYPDDKSVNINLGYIYARQANNLLE